MAWSGSDTRISTDVGLCPRDRSPTSANSRKQNGQKAKAQLIRTKHSKYRPSEKQNPDPTVARANKRHASRYGPIPPLDNENASHQMLVLQDPDPRTPIQELPAVKEPAGDPLGHRPGGNQEEAVSEASEWGDRAREEHLAQTAEEEARLEEGSRLTHWFLMSLCPFGGARFPIFLFHLKAGSE